MYGNTSYFGNLPAAYKAIVTAGLNAPPDIGPPNKTAIAKAAPIGSQEPVAKIIKTRNIVPRNSTKYLFILTIDILLNLNKKINIPKINFVLLN